MDLAININWVIAIEVHIPQFWHIYNKDFCICFSQLVTTDECYIALPGVMSSNNGGRCRDEY